MTSTSPEERASDEGFTLVEVVVSMLIFAILSAAVAGLLYRSGVTTALASQRTVATNLADQQKEYLLGIAWTDVAAASQTVKQNGADYKVDTAVQFIPDSSSGNVCAVATGASLASKKVTVTVTWKAMGGSAPVQVQTLRPIPMAQTGTVLGAVGWQLNNAAGKGLAGVPATLTSSTGVVRNAVSDVNGCVLFDQLDGGTYEVSVDKSGYVGPDNTQKQTYPVTVDEGKISVAPTQAYDQAGGIRVNVTVPNGYVLPAGYTSASQFGVTLDPGDSSIAPYRPLCGAGQTPAANACMSSTGEITGLFPRPYTIYAGCSSKNPGSTVTPLVGVTLPTGTVSLSGVTLDLTAGPAGLGLNATLLGRGGCPGQTIDLNAAQTIGPLALKLNIALPAGDWKLNVKNGPVGPLQSTDLTIDGTKVLQMDRTKTSVSVKLLDLVGVKL